jgi:hypothetical protein
MVSNKKIVKGQTTSASAKSGEEISGGVVTKGNNPSKEYKKANKKK